MNAPHTDNFLAAVTAYRNAIRASLLAMGSPVVAFVEGEPFAGQGVSAEAIHLAALLRLTERILYGISGTK